MINEYENTLRQVILDLLGNDYKKYGIPDDRVEKWIEKQTIDSKKSNGAITENRLIYFSDIYDLKNIIHKNWNVFKLMFNDKKRFEIFFDEIQLYRNTVMHGRNLTKSQHLLLEGIVTDLKTLKTIYHNRNQHREDFFIKIIKVNDNLGNVWNEQYENDVTLKVGDDYEVLVEAHDPKGREIEYEISSWEGGLKIIQANNRFNFKVTQDLISPHQSILIKATTPSSEYKNQDLFSIIIAVIP